MLCPASGFFGYGPVMLPADLGHCHVPGTPALHGDLLVVDLARPDVEEDAYPGELWRIPLDGVPPTRWTFGGHRDSAPRISPDGAWVAFLRTTGTEGRAARAQLYLMPTRGGDARQLTDLPLGAGAPVWSPDSRRIAFTARIPEAGRYGTRDGVGPDAERPRRITTLNYRSDNVGFVVDRHERLFVIDPFADRPEPTELTDGRCRIGDVVWMPDGDALVFAADRGLGTTDTLRQDLYGIEVAGGEPKLLVCTAGSVSFLAVSADGQAIYTGEPFDGEHTVATNHRLWSAPLSLAGPPAEPRALTDGETVACEYRSIRPVVTRHGVLVGVLHRGAVQLRLVPLDSDAAELDRLALVAAETEVLVSFAADDDRVAAVVATQDSPGEVVLVKLTDAGRPAGSTGPLTDFAAGLRAAGVHPLQELTAAASDGYPVHGFLMLPEGDGPHPVLLFVHGGPFMYHQRAFFDEAQVYASAGFAVVLPNPRGSAGYGEKHGRVLVNALGTVDVDDVLSLLDAALARPDCDAQRVGVMGGSYGGWMTSWLAAHHGDRFRAAWSERAVNAWDSFTGSSDIGWWFAAEYCGTDQETIRRLSPLHHADRVRIPFAVVHSEQDWRCPVEQAQRMFVALKRNNVPTELILFPGEGHEMSRSGRPRHRQERFELALQWWHRHLDPK
jgi:dipeptidyl aminopeptidase/acylaminoacyl peptidase